MDIIAILITIIGVVLALAALGVYEVPYGDAIIAIIVLVIGIGKLIKKL